MEEGKMDLSKKQECLENIKEIENYLKEKFALSFKNFLEKFSPFSKVTKEFLESYLTNNNLTIRWAPLGIVGSDIGMFKVKRDYTKKESIKKMNEFVNNLKQNSIEKDFAMSLFENIDNLISEDISKVEKEIDFKDTFTCLTISDEIIADIKNRENQFSCVKINKYENEINVLLLGKTGVGKSTLINGFLKKDLAPIKKTYEIKKYYNKELKEELNKFNLFDSKGLELMDKIEEKLQEINHQYKIINPDEFFHCIWFCTNVPRFEDYEKELLMELKEKYSKRKFVPIIFVRTKALGNKENKELEEEIKKQNNFSDNPLVPVIAKEIIEEEDEEEDDDDDDNKRINRIKPKGLKKLREKTIEMAKKTFILHYISEIKNKIDNVVIKDFIDKMWENFEEGLSRLEHIVLECGIDFAKNWYHDVNYFDIIEKSMIFFYNYRERDENKKKENEERAKKIIKKYKDCYGFSIIGSRFSKIYKIYKENKEKYLNDFMNDIYENKINELKEKKEEKIIDENICNKNYFRNIIAKRVFEFIDYDSEMILKSRFLKYILSKIIKKFLDLYFDEFSVMIKKCIEKELEK